MLVLSFFSQNNILCSAIYCLSPEQSEKQEKQKSFLIQGCKMGKCLNSFSIGTVKLNLTQKLETLIYQSSDSKLCLKSPVSAIVYNFLKFQYLREKKSSASANVPRNEAPGFFANLFHFCKKHLILKQKTVQSPLSNLHLPDWLLVQCTFKSLLLSCLFHCQCKTSAKSPQKNLFHLQTESGLGRFIPFFAMDRFSWFANFDEEKNTISF